MRIGIGYANHHAYAHFPRLPQKPKNELSTNSPDHFAMGTSAIGKERIEVEDNPDADVNPDRNTVDLDKEMSTLAENSILYKAALTLINKKMAMLKYGIGDGGR